MYGIRAMRKLSQNFLLDPRLAKRLGAVGALGRGRAAQRPPGGQPAVQRGQPAVGAVAAADLAAGGPFRRGRVPLALTFQLEVAQRINAPILDPQRCRLSVLCQAYCTAQHKLTLNGSSFVPPAEVDVGLVRLVPRKEPMIQQPFDLVEKVVNCLFNGRQKVLTNGVRNLFPRDRQDLVHRLIGLAQVDPLTRIIQLSVQEMSRICQVYEELCAQEPQLRQYNFRLGGGG
ncbi:hypothetical protein HPB48_020460 [Haemaphysalis longicornis]|uniref:rRNA adenine N(6)-methyltransferase n=1 Tax=Haemaphysalis longicornis TaxID=44386 RepID=A0A9J6FBT7_HAELO|nr:hypothetical protein HPB48_020460 [Haemaphysalis longicornis]